MLVLNWVYSWRVCENMWSQIAVSVARKEGQIMRKKISGIQASRRSWGREASTRTPTSPSLPRMNPDKTEWPPWATRLQIRTNSMSFLILAFATSVRAVGEKSQLQLRFTSKNSISLSKQLFTDQFTSSDHNSSSNWQLSSWMSFISLFPVEFPWINQSSSLFQPEL